MGFFFALAYDPVMRLAEEACLRDWRREILGSLSGEVLEIGAGTGANLALYPSTVTRLVAAEPDPHMRKRLDDRVRASALSHVETSDAAAHALPFADASFDAVVSTLVLCTVDDPILVLSEIGRVLRPSGKLAFLEHVAAEEGTSRLTWQRRIEPLWRHLAEGCHVTRRTAQSIRDAGFVMENEAHASMRKSFPWVRPTIRGVARKA